ncbi:unnamed protein product, partial [Iphiclides podalirius]
MMLGACLAGALHTEALRWAALGAICYRCGLGTRAGALRQVRGRLCALAALHAHLCAPALAAVSALALRDASLDRRILEGALVARSRGPCGGLALALRRGSSPAAPALAALNYALSLVAVPLALKFFCGQASWPPPSSVLWTACGTAGPFALGWWRRAGGGAPRGGGAAPRLLALLLLYVDCCALLRDAEGALYVTDVMATLFLEVSGVSLALALSSLYAHFGLLSRCESRALALAAVPKAPGLGWEARAGCMASGPARLPAVFLAPAQALLMAALYGADADADADADQMDALSYATALPSHHIK